MSTRLLLLGSVVLTVVLAAQSLQNPPSDGEVRNILVSHKSNLTKLVKMLQEDKGEVSFIGSGQVQSYPRDLTSKRRDEYLDATGILGDAFVTYGRGVTLVWLWTDKTALSRTRGKALAHFENLSENTYDKKAGLDEIGTSGKEGAYAAPLFENWFIIYVNID